MEYALKLDSERRYRILSRDEHSEAIDVSSSEGIRAST